MTQRLAEDAEEFQLNQAPPPHSTEGEILVATADGKGVPMRRPLEERLRSSHPRRGKGEKANKKQMAYVGAIYSIDPFVRSADDVLDEICRKQRAADRPQPQSKQVWAEMTTVDAAESGTGRERVFVKMAVACHDRAPERRKALVCLMDGEKALWEMAGEWLSRAVGLLVKRLWLAAYCLHEEGSTAAADFVSHYLRMLLQGKVGYVFGGLRRRELRVTPVSLVGRPYIQSSFVLSLRSDRNGISWLRRGARQRRTRDVSLDAHIHTAHSSPRHQQPTTNEADHTRFTHRPAAGGRSRCAHAKRRQSPQSSLV